MKVRILGRAKVAKNMTVALIVPVRPHLDVGPGDHIVFLQDEQGRIVVEKEMSKP